MTRWIHVIVVVEGPSAAGKTTWCLLHAATSLVPETAPPSPPPSDPLEAAVSWAEHGSERWAEAERLESASGLAVCDTDPLKLHYAWSLWRLGAGSRIDADQQAHAYRAAMAEGRLGFADRYVVEIPDPATLGQRRAGDHTRRRRNFELHARLAEPLREWYGTIEQLRPGSVSWGYPADGVSALAPSGLRRFDLAAFDALLHEVGLDPSAAGA